MPTPNFLKKSSHGHYVVGNQIYLNKTEAVYQASLTQQNVSWDFHNDIYGQIDWTKRPIGTLQDLYRERAQQIRDKYDYVIVQFSGGMDSWTVLHSFLSNGIHVDEIYTRWAFAERNYNNSDGTNTDQANLSSEFEYAALPVLDHIKKNYPNIKIVIDDFSENLQGEVSESVFFGSNQYQNLGTFHRFNRKSQYELEQQRKNKSIAVVYGYDKIRITMQDKNLYAYFSDNIGGVSSDPSRNIELFYWTPDFPEISVLQAHYLKDYFKENAKSIKDHQEYREIYQQVCCPDYNPATFQVGKAYGSLHWKSDAWIREYNPNYYQSWRWVTGQFLNSVDDQYKHKIHNNFVVGIKLFVSPLYLIEANSDISNFSLLSSKVFNN